MRKPVIVAAAVLLMVLAMAADSPPAGTGAGDNHAPTPPALRSIPTTNRRHRTRAAASHDQTR